MRLSSPIFCIDMSKSHYLQAHAAMNYVAPRWLPGGNLQTIWPALSARRKPAPAKFRRERWTTPDGDFIDVDFQTTAPGKTLLVLFHGLEGSSDSHYAQAFAEFARERGFDYVVPHFRGCSGELNHAPRAYHSGDFEEIGWILERLRLRCQGSMLAVGVSLGGNALLRWAQEMGAQSNCVVDALASVSSPLDLAASGRAIGRGFNRLVYTRQFLATMKPKALQKLAQYPGLFDAQALRGARDLYEFDNAFTAPLHGFRNTDDYWMRASAKPHLREIKVPALVVNACNDPFVPAWCLPRPQDAGNWVTLWQPAHGGHVGFPQGSMTGHERNMPDAVGAWLAAHISQ